MKRFFVAVCCCGFVALNVSAQEPVNAIQIESGQSVVAAPDSELVLASAIQEDVVAAPVVDAPVVGGVVEAGCSSCGQAAPVFSSAPVYAAAPVYGVAPVYSAAPAVDCCCEAGRPRPQVISRVRGRVTTVRTSVQGRIGNLRRNDDCCCN